MTHVGIESSCKTREKSESYSLLPSLAENGKGMVWVDVARGRAFQDIVRIKQVLVW
jgi:hypothetical protein